MEIWKQIKDYQYEISNYGNVRNWKGRILKRNKFKSASNRRTTYFRVSLKINTLNNLKYKQILVHRLVAEYFCEKKEYDKVVCHKDNNGLNNHYTNLYWGTQSDNVKQAYNDGLISNRKGINNPNYKNGNWMK